MLRAAFRGIARRALRWWRNDVASVPWGALFAALVTLVLGGWVSDALKGDALFTSIPWLGQRQWLVKLGLTTALVLFAWYVYLKRRELMSVGAVSQTNAEPRRALVLPLSPAGADVRELADGTLQVQRLDRTTGVPAGPAVSLRGRPETLKEDIEALAALKTWPWQQLLRAILPHRDSLLHLYLLGSAGKDGSHGDVEKARTLLTPYLPRCSRDRVHVAAPPVDFDDLKAMMAALRNAIRELKAQRIQATGRCLREEDIMIDVTGGFKPTSIAGAVMTLSSNVTFQYVHTSGENVVREYDLLHRGSPEG